MENIRKVAVIGSGIMGTAITQPVLLGGRVKVTLCDIDAGALKKSRQTIEKVIRALENRDRFFEHISAEHSLERFSELDFARTVRDRKLVGRIADGATADEILKNLELETDLEAAVSQADIVIEALPERLDLKQEVFKNLSELAPPHTICASNTSTLPVSKIAQYSKRPENAIGMHFHGFDQAFERLIEIMGSHETAAESLEIAKRFGESLPSIGGDRFVVRLEKESEGFIANRLYAPGRIYRTWFLDRAAEEGITFEQLHAGGFDMRWSDSIGLDTVVNAAHSYRDHVSADFAPPKMIVALVREGKLGRKTGQGIYTWDETGRPIIKETHAEEKTRRFFEKHQDIELEQATRLNEACRMLQKGVVKRYEVITQVEKTGEGREGIFEIGFNKYREWAEKLDAFADRIGKPYLKPCETMSTGNFVDYR